MADNGTYDITPLHEACQNGQTDIIETLLKNGVDVNVKDSKGCSPLHLTLFGGGHEKATLKLLESSECCVNIQDNNGQTPLHWAAHRSNVMILRHLINHGADVTLKDIHGQTALDLAISEDNVDIIEILLEEGAFFPEAMEKAISLAEDCGGEIVRMLLPFIFDVDEFRNEKGETALHRSVGGLNSEIPQILLEAGADIDAVTTGLKETPLHLVLECPWREDVKFLLNTLLNWLPDINIKNANGQTALEMSLLCLDDYENEIIKHVCKLYAAEMLKSWGLKISVESFLFPLHTDLYQDCKVEVNKLKCTKIQDISVYTLLTKSRNALVRLLRNKAVKSGLTNHFFKYLLIDYPIYGGWLKNKLKFVLTRTLLMESSRCSFNSLNLPYLPNHLTDLILFNLTNQELTALSKVCH